MRKFIVSDLHGNGEVYDSIIAYLENISLVDEVELFINGDLIDRGQDGYRMLEDVIERINGKGNIKINYLGGNHELMMYQALKKRKTGKSINYFCDWIRNGGRVIERELATREDGEEKCEEFKHFLGDLKIYHKFKEMVNGNSIILVHARAPRLVLEECNMQIKDNNREVLKSVWTRENDRGNLLLIIGKLLGYYSIGKGGFLTIKGHTPIKSFPGFIYNKEENFINIDGGCAGYAVGRSEYNHVPLVEVKDGYLELLIFNHNNEIIDGYYFDGEVKKMADYLIGSKRIFLNKNLDCNGLDNKKI